MRLLILFSTVLVLGAVASAEEPVTHEEGTRRLLIVCGHPGDEDHRVLYTETVDRLREELISRLGFDAAATQILFGTQEMLSDGGPAPRDVQAAATRENLAAAAERLRASLQPEDALWVIVIGHAHFDGLRSDFNLSGPDVDQEAFGRMFEGLACREMVFWITIPVSGFYIRPLSADGRVIITATEADLEINETIFPHVLADVLAEPPPAEELDVDGDGAPSLFDLYITVARRVARTYVDENTLSTEHARLEDNGDGRGSEVQRNFLTEELGGRLEEGESPRPLGRNEDGAAAARIILPGLDAAAEPPADDETPVEESDEP